MLDFRLETFLSVCNTMNYCKAAEQMHITQPAVTQHIQHLEQTYGCKLFLYENRQLKKTKAADILEQYARTMKINEDHLLHQLRNSQITALRIGATKTIGECVIGQFVEPFIACPHNQLDLIVDNTIHLLNLIDNCKLDFALIEGNFDKTKYGYTLYSRESFVGVCAPSHPFAGQSLSVSQVLKEPLLCREEGSGTRAILENKLSEYNESISHFSRTICISSFPMILEYVRKGYGISFVYEILAKQSGLATFRLENCDIQREFNFVYLKNTGAEEKIQRFIDCKPNNQ